MNFLGSQRLTDSARYVKIVEWSDEDKCFIGLFRGGCHGDDERAVFDELCTIVEETVDLYHRDARPLPPPTANQGLIHRLQPAA